MVRSARLTMLGNGPMNVLFPRFTRSAVFVCRSRTPGRTSSTADVLSRLDEALRLIEQYQPWRLRHLHRDLETFLVARFPCRGAYFPELRTCMTELTFLNRRNITAATVASSIVHEGIHARVDRMGVRRDNRDRAREERLCRRAELEFGQALPAALGGPVIERALWSLELADNEVAPEITGLRRKRSRMRSIGWQDEDDTMSPSKHSVRFPGESDSYRSARDELLDAEMALDRAIESVAAKRRTLPLGGRVPEDYAFEEAAGNGGETVKEVRLSSSRRGKGLADHLQLYVRSGNEGGVPVVHVDSQRARRAGAACLAESEYGGRSEVAHWEDNGLSAESWVAKSAALVISAIHL